MNTRDVRAVVNPVHDFIDLLHEYMLNISIATMQFSSVKHINDVHHIISNPQEMSKEINNHNMITGISKSHFSMEDLKMIKSIQGKYVRIKSTLKYQLNYRFQTNDQVKNYVLHEASACIRTLVNYHIFKHITFTTTCQKQYRLEMKRMMNSNHATVSYVLNKRDLRTKKKLLVSSLQSSMAFSESIVSRSATTSNIIDVEVSDEVNINNTNSFQHDRSKNLLIPYDEPFLYALNLTTRMKDRSSNSRIDKPNSVSRVHTDVYRPKVGMSDKLKQIQKFVEIVDQLITSCAIIHKKGAQHPLKVVDMCSGLSYLTFALHYHLFHEYSSIQTIGIDMRPALIASVNRIARSLDKRFDNLSFQQGYISDYITPTPSQQVPITHSVQHRNDTTDNIEYKDHYNNNNNNNNNNINNMASSRGKLSNVLNKQRNGPTITINGISESATSILEDIMKLSNGGSSQASSDMATTFSDSDGRRAASEASAIYGVDILVALHACDTATDDVIYCGIQHDAKIIVVSPCCHKEVRRFIDNHVSQSHTSMMIHNNNNQIHSSIGPMIHVMKYGIYRERQAEMVTDTIRAMVLDYMGYDTNVFEFINTEHTSKNIIITAIKRETSRDVETEYSNRSRDSRNFSDEDTTDAFTSDDNVKHYRHHHRDDQRRSLLRQNILALMKSCGIKSQRLTSLLGINI